MGIAVIESIERIKMIAILLIGVATAADVARAEPLAASVRSRRGEPVRDAVVYAVPEGSAVQSLPPPDRVAIDQVDKEFVPYVTAVYVGTRVNFPNRDRIRHHVYSFSAAKSFEIPLYAGMPEELVAFDRPGEVVLGCNIHDWMKAYVYVVDTPFFAVTDGAGRAAIELPAGDYRVEIWHPRLEGEPAATARALQLRAGEKPRLDFTIEEKRVWSPRRAPASDPDYR
jgi:plastocyanin